MMLIFTAFGGLFVGFFLQQLSEGKPHPILLLVGSVFLLVSFPWKGARK